MHLSFRFTNAEFPSYSLVFFSPGQARRLRSGFPRFWYNCICDCIGWQVWVSTVFKYCRNITSFPEILRFIAFPPMNKCLLLTFSANMILAEFASIWIFYNTWGLFLLRSSCSDNAKLNQQFCRHVGFLLRKKIALFKYSTACQFDPYKD